MTRLRVADGGETFEYPIAADRVVLGRNPDCDIVLATEGVSRQHAEIVRRGNDWWVADLGSRNGTFLNDRAIEREKLSPGDVIRLGPEVSIELLEDRPAGRASPVSTVPGARGARRGVVRHAPDAEDDESYAAGPASPAAAHGLPWWQQADWTLDPRASGSDPHAIGSAVTTVGRDPALGLVLYDESVSRVHARIDRRGRSLSVTDLKSANGTRVNGETVLQAGLHDGDTVAFGDVEFRVRAAFRPAWNRLIAIGAGALIALVAVLGGLRFADSLRERGELADAARRVREQALDGIRRGIAASSAGDADMARAHLLHAADLLLLSDLAPAGAGLERPGLLFREIARELPPGEREFDFARALDPEAVANSQARLANLTNREYVEHQVKRYAVELGQDPNVPQGFIDEVWGFVSDYERYRGGMQVMLRRSKDVMPRIRQILASRHLPEAFGYVPWVESALDPTQRSPVGALGLWQFMPATGREYGLHVDLANPARDERTHVERSTAAAADYIATMLREQGPEYFMLVLASYNRGPGAVSRAKQKIADPMLAAHRKFWYLSEHQLLPEETRKYVPKIFAVRVVAEAPERFGFESP
jgi:pSer/pThr/pTyr-binding forkhead associated (FHA) protein